MNGYIDRVSKKRLFLVCPTDNLEFTIYENFIGESFFYLSLGAYLEFDPKTQDNLKNLICEKAIEEVLFVCSIENDFYKKSIKQGELSDFQITESLIEIRNKVPESSNTTPMIYENIQLVMAYYLDSQKKRLLSSKCLGECLVRNRIDVNALVYYPKEKIFHSLQTIMNIGNLLKGISIN